MMKATGARWRQGFRGNIPASVAIAEVESIHKELGMVKPADVVDRARDKSNPLHPQFEWRDSVAAEKHRCQQARQMISNLVVVTIDGEEEGVLSPAYVSVITSEESGERGYVRVSCALNDDELRERALQDALRMLNGLRRRYSSLTRLVKLLDGVEGKLRKTLAA